MNLTQIKLYLKAFYIRFKGRPAALKKAIRRADKLCRKNRKRYRVLFLEQKYQAISRPEVQQKKHRGEWGRNVNVTKLDPLCFYDTLTGLSPEGQKLLTARSS